MKFFLLLLKWLKNEDFVMLVGEFLRMKEKISDMLSKTNILALHTLFFVYNGEKLYLYYKLCITQNQIQEQTLLIQA